MSATMIRVTGKFDSPDGGSVPSGTISFMLTGPMYDETDKVTISPALKVATLNRAGQLVGDNGALGQELVANDSPGLTPASTSYYVVVALVGVAPTSGYVQVPASAVGGTIDLSTLMPTA